MVGTPRAHGPHFGDHCSIVLFVVVLLTCGISPYVLGAVPLSAMRIADVTHLIFTSLFIVVSFDEQKFIFNLAKFLIIFLSSYCFLQSCWSASFCMKS